jgi:iron complex transport system ATP-binding protein
LLKIQHIIHPETKAGLVTLPDPNLALAYCDRLILLHEGKVASELKIQDATSDEIKTHLSAIYGEISILAYKNRNIVLNGE